MAGNAGGIAGGDPGRLRSLGRARAARMAPRTATAVVKATACAGARTGRSAGVLSCFSVRKGVCGGDSSPFVNPRETNSWSSRRGGGGGVGEDRTRRLRYR